MDETWPSSLSPPLCSFKTILAINLTASGGNLGLTRVRFLHSPLWSTHACLWQNLSQYQTNKQPEQRWRDSFLWKKEYSWWIIFENSTNIHFEVKLEQSLLTLPNNNHSGFHANCFSKHKRKVLPSKFDFLCEPEYFSDDSSCFNILNHPTNQLN